MQTVKNPTNGSRSNGPPSGRSAILRKLILAGCTFLLADLLLAQLAKVAWPFWNPARTEARYRITSEIYHHDLARRVDTRGVWGNLLYRVRTNSLGFRDATAREVPLRSGSHRLLVIGDSFTEGLGVAFERTFVGIIAGVLGADGIEVLNAAVLSYSPSIYYRKVRYLLEEVGLDVDEVVVFLDISDIQDEGWFYYIDDDDVVRFHERTPGWARVWDGTLGGRGGSAGIKGFLEDNSVTVHFASRVLERRFGQRLPGRADRLPRTGSQRAVWTTDRRYYEAYGRAGLERAGARMDALLSVLESRSIPLTVVVYPWPDQLAADDRDSVQVRFWSEWSRERGVQFVNLFPPFFDEGEPEQLLSRYYIPNDTHLNEVGHRLAAESFLASFRVGTER